jgi:hypothetical protein
VISFVLRNVFSRKITIFRKGGWMDAAAEDVVAKRKYRDPKFGFQPMSFY